MILFMLAVLVLTLVFVLQVDATNYGSGEYGSCQYSSCGITLTSSSAVAADITPVGTSTTCSVWEDVVEVTTGSSTGYTVTVGDADTSPHMAGSTGDTIVASSGTAASPTALLANTWGYRVDGLGGFGSGPTSISTSGDVPIETYAGVPPSNGSATTIITSAVAASTPAATSVWYGVCADLNIASGSYSDAIVYTAVIN